MMSGASPIGPNGKDMKRLRAYTFLPLGALVLLLCAPATGLSKPPVAPVKRPMDLRSFSSGATRKCCSPVVLATPLVIDLDDNGRPSLLAGPKWKWRRKASSKESVYRRIDLDGTGVKEWEWVGPEDGLLVWMKDLQETMKGKDLFGGNTWNKQWNNGFEPLCMLDENKDKLLTGDELKDIGVWQDANSDAIAQRGEIIRVADLGITSLDVTFKGAHSRAANSRGAVRNGRKLHVWDWWSAQRPEPSSLSTD